MGRMTMRICSIETKDTQACSPITCCCPVLRPRGDTTSVDLHGSTRQSVRNTPPSNVSNRDGDLQLCTDLVSEMRDYEQRTDVDVN